MIWFFKKNEQKAIEPFDEYVSKLLVVEPSVSLDSSLTKYIQKYDLLAQANLDEPGRVRDARCKLKILSESAMAQKANDPMIKNYFDGLNTLIQMYESMSPEMKRMVKEKEKMK